MNEGQTCVCLADTDGLLSIARSSANIRGVLLEFLRSGTIGVPSCAWKEFEALYEEEAALLKPFVTNKLIGKRAYYVGAASIADKLNSGFPRGAYDENVELMTASMALVNGCRILTSAAQTAIYERMECEASEPEAWVDELGSASLSVRANS